MAALGIRDARLLREDGNRTAVVAADVLIEGGVIAAIGPGAARAADRTLRAEGALCLPGFVQTHVHLCQTLMRGLADDLELLDWLATRIWPLEAAHTPASLRASARLGIAELLLGGTTTVLTMETVHHTDEVFRAAEELGIRATIGKTHMDHPDTPAGLKEETAASLAEAERLCRDWHGAAGGRLRYAYSPRFALSCTESLLEHAAELARRDSALLQTHASENREECARVAAATGLANIRYLDRVGALGPHTVLAHCVHLEDGEAERLAGRGVHVAHCPTCNLKLGSGIADTVGLLAAGVNVSLGADGAPCNNALDMFEEMKLAALLPKVRHGAAALPARRVLDMATCAGAHALGLGDVIGAVEEGRRGDVIVVAPRGPRGWPRELADPVSQIVYAGRASDVRHVVVDGKVLVKDGTLAGCDLDVLRADAEREAAGLCARAAAGG
ncbi:MAG: 5'-deoxyadenosine deaminase [Planctomycetes bacterium]|nr:5'-deoxyadenosine deaminase [Planctomycetota bacterium]